MSVAKPKSSVKILIVDSHETSRHVIAIMLHKLGYATVFEAGSEAEAEKIVKEHERDNKGLSSLLGGAAPGKVCDLDLVILDHEVPPNNGMICLAQIRRRFDAGSLPVLFTVMKGSESKLEGITAMGANDTLVKPFQMGELKNKISFLLGGGKAPVIQSFSFTKEPAKEAKKRTPAAVPPAPPPAAPPSAGEARAASSTGEIMAKQEPAGEGASPNGAEPIKRKQKPQREGTGGVGFHRRGGKKKWSPDDPPTATLVDGKIDGHYHEDVDVIGGGENCYWARKVEGEDQVRLFYLNAKGKSTGMEAKVVPLDEFMHTFFLCEEYGCSLLDRLKGN